MSKVKRRYKRIEEFFAGIRPVAPDPPASLSPAESAADGWSDVFSGIGSRRRMGFAFDRGKIFSLVETPLPLPEDALRVPLTASGKPIGSIRVAGKAAGLTADEIDIVGAVASQLAQHLEELSRPKPAAPSR
jgi:hypothetical protein